MSWAAQWASARNGTIAPEWVLAEGVLFLVPGMWDFLQDIAKVVVRLKTA
jgi:hypothetical protein